MLEFQEYLKSTNGLCMYEHFSDVKTHQPQQDYIFPLQSTKSRVNLHEWFPNFLLVTLKTTINI